MDPARRWWKKAGVNTQFIHYSFPLGAHTLMVMDADDVKEILFSNYGQKPRFTKNLGSLIPIVGNGLVTLEGRDWQRHRRIIHPSFQPGLIRESLGDFIPKIMSRFIEYWEKANGREIDVNSHISNLTLDILGDVAFSHDFHAMRSIERWVHHRDSNGEKIDSVHDRVVQSLGEIVENGTKRVLLRAMNLHALDFSTARTQRRMDSAVEDVVIEARRKLKSQTEMGNTQTPTSPKDGQTKIIEGEQSRISLLQRLMDAENSVEKKSARKSLETHELRDEVKTFLLAGHETTSTWCYWTFFALCKYPDIQEKVFQDVRKHSSPDKKSDISIESIEKMSYFNAFMQEVLRFYPPAGIIFRFNVKEETFKGVTIPAETRLAIPIHLLHRHPKYWKEPESFQPERWLGKEHPSSHKQAFMPFSNGPRNCIGYQFAETEVKLLMAHLIRHFLFRLAPSQRDTDFIFTLSITMKTNPKLKIITQNRE